MKGIVNRGDPTKILWFFSRRHSFGFPWKSMLSSYKLLSFVYICQVEEDVAPLARANAQIRESLEQLQQHLMQLRSVSAMDASLTDSLLD